jgi:transposase-like protein
MPSEANTASKDVPYFVSRSRMRNLNPEIRWSRSARRFRAAWVVQAEAVQMVLETRRSIAEVARDLGIHDGTLG